MEPTSSWAWSEHRSGSSVVSETKRPARSHISTDLAERYGWLAEYHRRKGNTTVADRYSRGAKPHLRLGPDDDPPPFALAATLAVPRPPSDWRRPDATPYLGDDDEVA